MTEPNKTKNQPNLLVRGAEAVGDFVVWHLVDGPKAATAMREQVDAEAIFAHSHGFPRTEMEEGTGVIRQFDRSGTEVHPDTDIPIAVQPPFNTVLPPKEQQK